MKKFSFVVAVVIAITGMAGSAFGQGFPLPTQCVANCNSTTPTAGLSVTCPGCPAVRTGFNNTTNQWVLGNPPYPFADPIVAFTGRYVDSVFTRDWQQTFRTARSYGFKVNPEKNRIYFTLGSAVAAYNLDTFFARLENKELLTNSQQIGIPNNGHPNGEAEYFLKWNKFFYAENTPTAPVKWITPVIDGQERLLNFDYDDRGYIYMAYSYFSWGITQDDFTSDGGLMTSVFQSQKSSTEPGDFADVVIPFKTSGGRYYVLVGAPSSATMQMFDATNPGNPTPAGTFGRYLNRYARTSTTLAGVHNGKVYIYSNDAIPIGAGPQQEFTLQGSGRYNAITTDGTNFYAAGRHPSGKLILSTFVRQPSGTYTELQTASNYEFEAYNIRWGGDHVTLVGMQLPIGENVLLYKLINGVPDEVPFNGYFNKHYNSPQAGYTKPERSGILGASAYRSGSKLYMIVAAYGLGDVYQIKSEDAITVKLRGRAGTDNPRAPQRVDGDIFYGDRVKFIAETPGAQKSIQWNFGNPEAAPGADPNIDPAGATGIEVQHQYSGLTPATLGGVRTVTATGPAASSSVTLTLKAPVARLGITGISTLFTQANASSPAPIVLGDSLFEASDGEMSGHFVEWKFNGGASLFATPGDLLPLTDCGSKTLELVSHYGSLNGFAVRGADYAVGLTPVNGSSQFRFAVQPYAAAINPPALSNGTLFFTSASRFTSVAGVVAPLVNLNYVWDLLNPTGGVVRSSLPTNASTIGSFSVPESEIPGPGYRVRLTISSPATNAPCAGYTQSIAVTEPLNYPDPQIVGGCANGGPPCTFSVTSPSGANTGAWTLEWSVTPTAGVFGATASGATFTPIFTQLNTYTVTVKATRDGLSKTNSIQVTPSTVGTTCQQMSPADLFIAFQGPSSGCRPTNPTCSAGESIPFSVQKFLSYDFGCAPHTYSWTFGDNSTGSGKDAPHAYQTPGSYNVSVLVNNGAQQLTLTQPVTVSSGGNPGGGGGGGGGGGNPGGCPNMNATNIFIGVKGATSNCTAINPNCSTGENITFTASGFNYFFNCGNHSFSWSINGQPRSGQEVTMSFPSPGTYPVSLTVNNGSQTYQTQMNVNVGGGGNQSCGSMNNSSVFLTYSGAGCGTGSGNPCGVNGNVTFNVATSNYNLSCATHTYEWNVDGTTASGASSITRSFGAGSHSVFVKVTNTSNGSVFQTLPVSLTVASGGGTGGGNCPQMDGLNVFIGWRNASNSCNQFGGNNCSTNEAITFEAMGFNYDFSCANHSFAWEIAGTPKSGKSVQHVFPGPGTFPVKLTVNNGQNLILEKTITIGGGGNPGLPDVDLNFSSTAIPGVANGYVFIPEASPSSVVSRWVWEFGDGKGDTINGPNGMTSHIYAQSGDYTVRLTVYDNLGRELKSHSEKPGETDKPAKRRGVRH